MGRRGGLVALLVVGLLVWAAGPAPSWPGPSDAAGHLPVARDGGDVPADPAVNPESDASAAVNTTAAAADGLAAPAPETPSGPLSGLAQVAQVLLPVRVPRPVVPPGPRRIGLQVGHWRTDELPPELHRLEVQTGTSWGGVAEWQLNLDVANRAAAVLRGRGYAVDVLPTTVPPGYLADVFLALHADGDPAGVARGFKAAHGSRRGPYEDQLVRDVVEEYGRATGLPVDPAVTRNMLGYYAFSWTRIPYSAAPHTPAAILEMGFLTSAADRPTLLNRTDIVVTGVVNGIQRFLDEVPAGAAFADDLIVPPAPPFRPSTPTAR